MANIPLLAGMLYVLGLAMLCLALFGEWTEDKGSRIANWLEVYAAFCFLIGAAIHLWMRTPA